MRLYTTRGPLILADSKKYLSRVALIQSWKPIQTSSRLFNHSPDAILARSTSGTLRLSLDDKGLAYSFEMPNTSVGNDLAELMKRGDIHGSSFAFVTGKAEFRSDDSGKSVRYISNIASLHDVAVVSTPAYPKAGAAIRSFKRWQKKQVESQLDKTVPIELQGRLSVLRQQARRSSF